MARDVLEVLALLQQGCGPSDRQLLHAAATRALEERLSVFLLEAGRPQPHRRIPGAGLRQLRLAEEFIRSHAGATLRIEDIAAAAGVGPRSLQATFRRHRGLTPHQVLTRVRLEGARLRLAEGRPADSVTDIALHAGFAHLGRFSQVYAQRFGESPSATLRRGQVGPAPV
jgi:transcriptional regulator GlxA family with amidase domain